METSDKSRQALKNHVFSCNVCIKAEKNDICRDARQLRLLHEESLIRDKVAERLKIQHNN